MIKIVCVALIGVFFSLILKKINSGIGVAVAVFTGVFVIYLLYEEINNIISVFKTFTSGYGVSEQHIKLLVKVLGISYITQFGVSVAEECGEKFVAKKIELGGKILIVSLSVPMLLNLLDNIINFL